MLATPSSPVREQTWPLWVSMRSMQVRGVLSCGIVWCLALKRTVGGLVLFVDAPKQASPEVYALKDARYTVRV